MREIKFRAWDKSTKKYRYPKLWDNTMPSNWEQHYELEQFTGLKDKNGKEIYEGKESVKLIIKGCGEGLADIVMYEGKWCVFEKSQGYAPLFDLLNGNSTEIISLDPR